MFLSIMLAIINISPVYAEQMSYEAAVSEENTGFYEEVGSMLGYFGYDESESIYCSQLLDVITEDKDEKAMLVFEEEEIVGLLLGTDINGETLYSFIYNDFEELSENVKEGNEIALVSNDEQLVCVSDDEIELLAGDKEELSDTIEEINNMEKVECEKIKKIPLPDNISFEVNEKQMPIKEEGIAYEEINNNLNEYKNVVTDAKIAIDRYHTSYKLLNVPWLVNENSDYGKGLCWTAAGAMISRYYGKGNYTAKSLYRKLKNSYNKEPVGTKDWFNTMFAALNLRYNVYDRKLSYDEVFTELKKNRPITVSLRRYINGKHMGAHSVVLCGSFCYLADAKYYYVYRDSNVNGYVVNSIISSTLQTKTGSTFYYVGADDYNNWDMTHVVYK